MNFRNLFYYVQLLAIHAFPCGLLGLIKTCHAVSCTVATFRNKFIDKWQRKTEVTTGVAAIKSKLHGINQNISEQVASYMRDPSRMVGQMQMRKSAVSETTFYSLKKLHAKKGKIVDRRATKRRKIRYNVYEKIVNFMAPETMGVSPMLPDLNNLFGLKKQKPAFIV
ncbi:uncharacterized protein LOC126628555 isoform X3 [Malus sylvestris]|uniref:uncharacterized protein LOC126628555 isoform X3 n=1 Tax=Malus sylvestris TaxID=3752 RepID=UPI0021ABB728|nr:uncharacterized protein LOC126628555 isoform X3 [Malus sylvestris]